MADRERISVVMPVKNGEKYLSRALESIVRQTRPVDEILVIDGHSDDGSVAIAKSFPGVTVVQQKEVGIPSAYNQGIKTSRGEIVAFLSNDDVWLERKIELQAGFLESHPEIDFVTCKARFFQVGEIAEGFRAEWADQDLTAHTLETLVARKTVFSRIGLFNEEYAVAEDIDWFARAIDARIKTHVVDKVLLHKMYHGKNASTSDPKNSAFLLKAIRQKLKRVRARGND
jgi:glycosyltransferase involved in cell wall biosynthesis